jgi:hypothetical protein
LCLAKYLSMRFLSPCCVISEYPTAPNGTDLYLFPCNRKRALNLCFPSFAGVTLIKYGIYIVEMKTIKQKFHEQHGIPEKTSLDIYQIATLSKYPIDALKQVYRRATAPKEGMKADPFIEKKIKKPVKKKPVLEEFIVKPDGKGYGRVYSFASGKFGKDRDIAEIYGFAPVVAKVSPEAERTDILTLLASDDTVSDEDL